jgi:hypothetical protein
MFFRRSALTALVLFTSVSLALACGTERWAVKTGADRDSGAVNLTPEDTTIALLSDLHAPPKPNTRATSRFSPTEFKTFTISGIVVGIKQEKDEDYHIVLQAPGDPEGTMVIESVSPNCTNNSKFTDKIVDVRKTIDQKIKGISGKMKKLNLPVTVTGVGFFDPIHGQTGVAPNGIELHPILEITFN